MRLATSQSASNQWQSHWPRQGKSESISVGEAVVITALDEEGRTCLGKQPTRVAQGTVDQEGKARRGKNGRAECEREKSRKEEGTYQALLPVLGNTYR